MSEEKNKDEIRLIVGNDNGNSEHDIIINGKLIKQPNAFSRVRKLPNFDEVNKEFVLDNIEKNLIVTVAEPNGIYYIGEAALSSGNVVRSIEVGVDNNKVKSDIVVVNTLAQIAGQATVEYYKKNGNYNEIIKAKVDMSTALPVSYYSNQVANEFSNKFLNKKHLVTVHIGNTEANVEIEFEYTKTIPEGVTATFALREAPDKLFSEYNENNDDKLDQEFFKKPNVRVLHVGIGEGTTELPLTRGIEFDPNFINGINNGIGHAIDKALDEFKTEKGLAKFSRQDYSEIIKNPKHKYYDLAMEIVEPYILEEADEILRNIKLEIQRANNEIDVVCVYGGGSILMRESLEKNLKTFCNRAEIKLLYVPKEYAVTLEAEGLNSFVNSSIYKALKAKNKK